MEETDIEIRAYLSYRRSESEREDLNALKIACKNRKIELVDDESGTEEGDSIIEFMNNDLVGARFVIPLLTPEYFTKPYTLHEFLEIAKDIEATNRLYFCPVRKSKKMVSTFVSTIRQDWRDMDSPNIQRSTKEKLAELQDPDLKISELNEKELQKKYSDLGGRIEAAWRNLVEPQLNRVCKAADSAENIEIFYETMAEKILNDAKNSRESSQKELEKEVKTHLKFILSKNSQFTRLIGEELRLNNSKDEEAISSRFVNKGALPVINEILGRILDNQKKKSLPNRNPELWLDYCGAAKELCGWMILLSISPDWWIHNSFRLKNQINTGIRSTLELSKHSYSYSEVIVSRTMLSQALFQLDANGNNVVSRKNNPDTVLFDVTDKSVKETILTPIHKEYLGGQVPDDDEALLEDILFAADNAYDRLPESERKPGIFLITKGLLEKIYKVDWFLEMEEKLAGKLLFVCIDTPDESCAHQPCVENTRKLLDAVAHIYRLENN